MMMMLLLLYDIMIGATKGFSGLWSSIVFEILCYVAERGGGFYFGKSCLKKSNVMFVLDSWRATYQ
jgi:hypothetical protein